VAVLRRHAAAVWRRLLLLLVRVRRAQEEQ
jgi:hypothetical protein